MTDLSAWRAPVCKHGFRGYPALDRGEPFVRPIWSDGCLCPILPSPPRQAQKHISDLPARRNTEEIAEQYIRWTYIFRQTDVVYGQLYSASCLSIISRIRKCCVAEGDVFFLLFFHHGLVHPSEPPGQSWSVLSRFLHCIITWWGQ